MRNKFLVNVTAIATAFTMVAAPSITAFATDANPEPETTTQHATAPGNVVDNDIVINDGHSAVEATTSGTSITVNGNIDQSGSYEHTSGDSTTNYSDDAINAQNASSVVINGNVVSGQSAIFAYSESSVEVNGNVNAVGSKTKVDVFDSNNNYSHSYTSYSSTGITSDGTADVTVAGTVDAWSKGVSLNLAATDGSNTDIVIGDAITVADGTGIYITNKHIFDTSTNKLTAVYLTEDEAKTAIPDNITVFEINANAPIRVAIESAENEYLDIQDEVEAAIHYIIKKEEGITFADTSKLTTITSGSNSYDTIKKGDSFKVNATVNNGYYLDAGKNVSITKNEDGTYTLLFKNDQANSKGGIYVRALLIPTPAKEDASKPEYTVVVQETTPVITSSTPVASGAIVISNTTSAADMSSAIAAISGTKPARTVSYNIANVTPAQYKASVIENVAAAPTNGAFNIETDRVSCFDRKMIEAIASRPDIDVNVVFTYGGKKLKVTIPAGYNVRTLLDEGGYCGFLRLMALLGATELS